MKPYRILLLCLLSLLASASALITAHSAPTPRPPAILRVCPTCGTGYYATISAAMSAAQAGDEIQIATGVYTERVDINRDITVRGSYNISFTLQNPLSTPTTIDGTGARHALFILGTSGAPISVTLDALRLTRGQATGLFTPDNVGGGLYARYLRAFTMTRCQALANLALVSGGGAYIANAPGTRIELSAFYGNGSLRGAGLTLENSPATQIITAGIGFNFGGTDSGGLLLRNSPYTRLDFGAIGVNSAPSAAGLLIDASSPVTLSRMLVVSNTATSGNGGGVLVQNTAQVYFDSIEFYNNSAAGQGSAAYLGMLTSAQLVNLFVNTAVTQTSQSEVWLAGGNVALLHNTLIGRKTAPGFVIAGASAVFTNNLIVSTTLGVRVDSGSAQVAYTGWYSNTQDYSGAVTAQHDLSLGAPLFLLQNDFHLGPGSPYVERGIATWLDHDANGLTRPFGLAPDIGADETRVVWQVLFAPLAVYNTP